MNITSEDQILFFENQDEVDGLKLHQPAFFVRCATTIRLFEEPTWFMHVNYVENGRTPSIHTWKAVGYSLKTWFEFLQAVGLDWRLATRQDRVDYRDTYLSSISPRTGETYSTITVRNRMMFIQEFYRFATQRGWYSGDIASGEFCNEITIARSDPLAHIAGHSKPKLIDRDLPKKIQGNRIHPFQVRDLKKLLQHLGPRSSERGGDIRPARDRILADLGWVVGLRLAEIQQLTTLQFLKLHVDPLQPLIDNALTIHRGKGGKSRVVAIPSWLVQDIQHYIENERIDALNKGKISSKSATTILLIGNCESNNPGKPLKYRRLQQIIEDACFAIGLIDEVEVIDPETSEPYIKKKARHGIHDLRHTYAALTYHAELKNGNSEPWKKIQAQLGHASLQTTIDTYLRHVEIFGEKQKLVDVRKMVGL